MPTPTPTLRPVSLPVLQAHGLSVWSAAHCLMPPIDLALQAGEALCVIGESGAGKSLLLQAIMGLLPEGLRAEGNLLIQGQASSAADVRGRRAQWGRQLSLLPQEPTRALDALRSVHQQLDAVHRWVAQLPASTRPSHNLDALKRARLTDACSLRPWQLSGGMAQRAATQLALAGGASLLLADEPSKGLDPEGIQALIVQLKALMDRGGSVVVVTHDLRLAQALPGQTMVMRHGQVVEHGATEQVLTQPRQAFTRQWLDAAPSRWPRPQPPAQAAQASCSATVLRAENLVITRGHRILRQGLNLHWRTGDRHVIQGPSGCGKSTLGDTLLGLLPPHRGRVLRATGLAPTAFQKLYQDPVQSFAPHQRLKHHLQEVARRHGTPWPQVLQWLHDCGVAEPMLERPATQVSGGELQRVAVVRALCARPVFLFADEPTSRLDPVTQQSTCEMLHKALAPEGTATLWVTHDADLAHALSPSPLQWRLGAEASSVSQ